MLARPRNEHLCILNIVENERLIGFQERLRLSNRQQGWRGEFAIGRKLFYKILLRGIELVFDLIMFQTQPRQARVVSPVIGLSNLRRNQTIQSIELGLQILLTPDRGSHGITAPRKARGHLGNSRTGACFMRTLGGLECFVREPRFITRVCNMTQGTHKRGIETEQLRIMRQCTAIG